MSTTHPSLQHSSLAATAAAQAPDTWQATRAQTAFATQILRTEDDYLAPEQQDIGRAVGNNLRELFVSCDPAPAMLQQFDHLRPEFIAVHDIGTASSRKLIAGLAAASGRAVQKLVIRRQGFGTALATLEFAELPSVEGGLLRVYTTECEADTVSRRALARALLGHSRLGVVMVGDLPNHALAAALEPLRSDMVHGPWPNRHLLLLPLASAAAVVTQGAELGRGIGVTVRTTPQVSRPADAWPFINGTWDRLREEFASAGASLPGLSSAAGPKRAAPPPASAAPLPMRAMPPVPVTPRRPPAVTPQLSGRLAHYVRQLSGLNGMQSCCVFEAATGHSVASAGSTPDANALAGFGAALLSSMSEISRELGLGQAVPEATVTLEAHHLVLRALAQHPGLVLHAVLDKQANLTLARLQILRMDAVLDA